MPKEVWSSNVVISEIYSRLIFNWNFVCIILVGWLINFQGNSREKEKEREGRHTHLDFNILVLWTTFCECRASIGHVFLHTHLYMWKELAYRFIKYLISSSIFQLHLRNFLHGIVVQSFNFQLKNLCILYYFDN